MLLCDVIVAHELAFVYFWCFKLMGNIENHTDSVRHTRNWMWIIWQGLHCTEHRAPSEHNVFKIHMEIWIYTMAIPNICICIGWSVVRLLVFIAHVRKCGIFEFDIMNCVCLEHISNVFLPFLRIRNIELNSFHTQQCVRCGTVYGSYGAIRTHSQDFLHLQWFFYGFGL